MNSKLEPGDLAIIIKSVDGASVGKIVTAVKVAGTHSKYGTVWLIESPSILVTEFGGVGNQAHSPEDWLRKIPKDPLPDFDEDEELNLDKEVTA
jgi:hypothetical protein